MAEKAETFLNCSLDWTALEGPLLAHRISKFKPLITRIESSQVDALLEASKQHQANSVTASPDSATQDTLEPENYISFDDFSKIDLRIAKIVAAEHIEGADKLLRHFSL